MQRGTSRHGRAVDDELSSEMRQMGANTTPRAESWRDPEIPVEGEAGGDMPTSNIGTPQGMSKGDVDGRSQLARFLDTGKLPANADSIRGMAYSHNAPDAVLDELEQLPDGLYENVNAVWKTLGHGVEEPRNIDE